MNDKALTPPHLRAARFEDYAAIRRLALDHSIAFPSLEDWGHRWRDNTVWQRLGDRAPIGWVLETTSGEIVGSMETVPSLYKFRGSELVAAATSLWCVKAPYRGFALELLDEYFNQSVDLFITTTASSAAIATVRQFFDPVPVGRWDTISCCIGDFRAFAKHALQKLHAPFPGILSFPVTVALTLAQALRRKPPLPKAPLDVAIETADGFDSRFDTFWHELVRLNPEKLVAERSSAVLAWHFSAAMRERRLWIFTASRHGRLIGYCVFMQAESAERFKRVRLVDCQSIDDDLDLLPAFIRVALRRCAAEGFDVLDHLGVGVPRMHALDQYAFYHRALNTWTFLFRASNSDLDAELHQAQFWDPSLFDGDATLCL